MAFPDITVALNELYTTTWQIRVNGLHDQIMDASPFYRIMTQGDRVQKIEGGRLIEVPLQFFKNNSVEAISRGDSVGLHDDQKYTVAQYEWKNITAHIQRFYADFQKNRGKAAVINRVKADIDNARDAMIDKFETDLFGAGTANSNKTFLGLDIIVAENGIGATSAPGPVGGIDATTQTWWKNQFKDMSALDTSVHLTKEMNTMFNDCGTKGEGISRFPDLLICDQTVYQFYEEEALEISKISKGKGGLGDLGFGDLFFKGRPITWSPSCKSGSIYFLNTKFLKWIVDPIAILAMGAWLPITLQPNDVVAHIMHTCALVCSNRFRQGVMFNIT